MSHTPGALPRHRQVGVVAVALVAAAALTPGDAPQDLAGRARVGGAQAVVLRAAELPEPCPRPSRSDLSRSSTRDLVGVLDIYSRVPGATAAGTGIALDPSGEVVTNNHVVADAASIVATDPTTGHTYPAVLLGTDTRHDIAVIGLVGALNLPTANLGDSDTVELGDLVEAAGNVGGRGGAPTITTGHVTGLEQSVIAQDEYTHQQRRLHGMIKVDAVVQAGDSGGPLLKDGQVIGMDTAGGTAGYAIPINTVIAAAHRLDPSSPRPSPDPEPDGWRPRDPRTLQSRSSGLSVRRILAIG